MSEGQQKPLKTWSTFGDIRRKPNEYEVMTHGLNYTARTDKKAPLESNPTSPMNMWLRTYRDRSPFRCDDWEGFRDPAKTTYRRYVQVQAEAEQVLTGVLDEYDGIGHDTKHAPAWRALLGKAFTPQRFLVHGLQMTQAYLGSIAPSSYVTNAAAFATGDLLRRNSILAYRTRQLQRAWPDAGFATGDRATWENDAEWQPIRKAIETALVAYDFGETLVAVNLVLRPALDQIFLRELGRVARDAGDGLTWLVSSSLGADSDRALAWSVALARYGIDKRAENKEALARWARRWKERSEPAIASAAALVGGGDARATAEIALAATKRRDVALAEAGLS